MVRLYLFGCLLLLSHPLFAQWPADKLHIRANTFFNVGFERGIVSGELLLDRTRSFLGTGAIVQYDLFKKGRHEVFAGLHYGIMTYHRRYVPYKDLSWFRDWEWGRLGRVSQLGLLMGYRFWLHKDYADEFSFALEVSGDFSRYQLEKSAFHHQFFIQRWRPAFNFQFLAQMGRYQFGPFVRWLNQYPVERNYYWYSESVSMYDKPDWGSAYSKHGRLQLGLMAGYRF